MDGVDGAFWTFCRMSFENWWKGFGKKQEWASSMAKPHSVSVQPSTFLFIIQSLADA